MDVNKVEILLIEDNMNDAELAIRAFKKGNINNTLVHLKDGAQALEFLYGTGKFEGRDTTNKPKVILLDLKMPKMDGLEVLTHIKAHELTKAIPVVVLTSSKEHPDIERAYSLGANSYIVKPVELDEFTKVVTDLGFYWLLKNQSPV
ncbi:response regulator [Gelidibacter salicanalis]|uniref:Response regulator n=1 Tax=Gelidibacter salicanalis TaxID=291193 RepID=A0A5C7AD52_9FLAO|nr:response regulator [Gelidibacter salicanalis]TXE06606.1 response regulator [Gelidibacter salicanalis]